MELRELINKLNNDIELEDFEVKKSENELPKNIWDTVCAFSNTNGGWIILGVSEKNVKGKKYYNHDLCKSLIFKI
jgi:ATP-dependent DNA helicase RecG